MYGNKTIACSLIFLVILATSCKARYYSEDLEEAGFLDKRDELIAELFRRVKKTKSSNYSFSV
jgi:formiminotetrahydrofolate cyclodeaminase